MEDIGSVGGYAGTTNWYQYDVEAMWRMLENQQTDNHWKHAAGWRKTYELTATHMSRLRQYRDGLAEAWPPERSAAARAYIERLDYLISTVQQTYEIASANYTAFTGATSAISMSRHDLKEIYDEYVLKKAAKDEQDRRAASSTPTPSPSPSGARPVTQADLDQLNNRARSIMYALSGELVQAQVQLRQPPPYKSPQTITPSDPDVYGGGGSAPPVIPPVVPMPTTAPSASGGAPPSMETVPAPSAPGAGPVLGGVKTPTAPNPIAPPVITPPTPPPTALPPGIPTPLPPGPGLLPPGVKGLPTAPPPIVPGTTGGLPKPGPLGIAGAPRAMPPGGMIGGLPGAGLGQPAAATGPARRINPVGGMISGQGSGPTIVKGTGQRSGVTSVSRTVAKERDDARPTAQWDPDNPWATEDGVAPVVLPPSRGGRIDPGPAIGSSR